MSTDIPNDSNSPGASPMISLDKPRIIGLSKVSEETLLKEVKRQALKKCKVHVENYVECVNENSLLLYKCSDLVKEMNNCVRRYTTHKHFDEHRLKYMNDKQHAGKK